MHPLPNKRFCFAAAGIGIFAVCAAPHVQAQEQNHAQAQEAAPKPFVTDGTLNADDWTLIQGFSDDFNGKTLDTAKWQTHVRSWGRNWSWSAGDVSLADGKLDLALKYAPHQRGDKTIEYTAGIARAQAPVLYGYFEAKLKAPALNPGAKGAFWLGPPLPGRGRDPLLWTEIDIVETNLYARQVDDFSIPHNVHVFIHPDARKPSTIPSWAMSVGRGKVDWNPSAAYHVYGCLWTPQVIKMYVDGKLQGTITNRWWHQPLYLMMQNTVNWPYRRGKQDEGQGSPKGFPNVASVEYVRVWKSPNEVLPPATPQGSVPNKNLWKAGLDYHEAGHD